MYTSQSTAHIARGLVVLVNKVVQKQWLALRKSVATEAVAHAQLAIHHLLYYKGIVTLTAHYHYAVGIPHDAYALLLRYAVGTYRLCIYKVAVTFACQCRALLKCLITLVPHIARQYIERILSRGAFPLFAQVTPQALECRHTQVLVSQLFDTHRQILKVARSRHYASGTFLYGTTQVYVFVLFIHNSTMRRQATLLCYAKVKINFVCTKYLIEINQYEPIYEPE